MKILLVLLLLCTTGLARDFSLILGRPTDRSITLSVLSAMDVEGYVEYGTTPETYSVRTESQEVKAGVPTEFELSPLTPDTRYYYRLGKQEGTFYTQRALGSSFTFALQGDSHPERAGKMFDGKLYEQTLRNVALEQPDFYLTLGDDFSVERLIERKTLSQVAVDQVYAQQRDFLGAVGRSAALFLVNGNHEQAARCNLDGTSTNCAVLAGSARIRFFPLPAPDAFYTGDAEEVQFIGLLRDYYAWTWGDALFVVIDPYWHSAETVDNVAGSRQHGKPDPLGVTLGDAQYRWLTQTLTESKAKWKFVFSHHVLGTGRGGIECAPFGEWGGKTHRGTSSFAEKRPDWTLPIHDLFVKSGVTIFFQGHDHLFARQELDGVIYQTCPNPADPTYTAFNREAYLSGDVLPNAGHLRVSVSPAIVRVDYVRSFLPGGNETNATVAFSYTIQK